VAESAIANIAALAYRWGNLQAIRYDPARTDVFPPPYLVCLYYKTLYSGRSRLGSLPALFCGMADLSCEAIVGYLQKLPVIVLGEWREHDPPPLRFHPLGFCFPTTFTSALPPIAPADNRNFSFCAYTFFQESWGTPQQSVLSYLGLSYLFGEFHLAAIGGSRYTSNQLTARWTKRLGFREIGTVPNMLIDSATGDTTGAVISVLERAEFERRLGSILSEV
jgi:hypothetical protein